MGTKAGHTQVKGHVPRKSVEELATLLGWNGVDRQKFPSGYLTHLITNAIENSLVNLREAQAALTNAEGLPNFTPSQTEASELSAEELKLLED